MKAYMQFCGLSRAAELVGDRWTLIIIRDLVVSPKRFNELRHGIPGIPSNLLSARLKELEEGGIVERGLEQTSVQYRLTPYGLDLAPIINALGLWGARRLDRPHEGEAPTDNSLAASLLASRTDTAVEPFTVEVTAGPATAHAQVLDHGVTVGTGAHADAELRLGGQGLRQLMAHGDAASLLDDGSIEVHGPQALLHRFTLAFRAPLD